MIIRGKSGLLDAPVRSGRAEGVDTLRGVFAIWVLFAHLVPWAAITQGDRVPGLDLLMTGLHTLFQPAPESHPAVLGFIVLSGYCIHRGGFRRDRGFHAGYGIRRLFRIGPVFVLGALAGVVAVMVSRLADPALAARLSGTPELSAACFTAKVAGVPAFLPSLRPCNFQGNAPLNTVMVEIWLYVAYPLLLWVVRRSGERWLWGLLAAIWVGGVAAIWIEPSLARWWHTSSLAGFLLYWWIGAKVLDPRFRALAEQHVWMVLGGWGALTLFMLATGETPILAVETRKVLFAILVALLIARLDGRSVTDTLKPFSSVGRAGYSLYAFHAPVAYTLLIYGVAWWLVAAVAIGVGALMYVLVERPLMALGRRRVFALQA